MMKVLAIDTATDNCSCALKVGDEVFEESVIAPQQHAQLLLPMIDKLMERGGVAREELDGLVFGRGPGSFTGLRIATAAAQGIAYALEIPVVGVSTLQALAHSQFRLQGQAFSVACIDARMNEVYWGAYQTHGYGNTVLLGEERVEAPERVNAPDDRNWQLVGSGTLVCQKVQLPLAAGAGDFQARSLPQAVDMLALAAPKLEKGEGVAADQALPVYLRNKVALTEAERQQQSS